MQITSALSIASMLLTIGSLVGGFIAYKSAVNRTVSEIQEHVINALQQEISVLNDKIAALERENNRLDQIILTMCEALKKRGMIISIDGNLVTISDGRNTHSARIQGV